MLSTDEQLSGQLQLDRWPACQSLCFNLRRLYRAVELTEAQIEQLTHAGALLPMLRCLHIIGNPYLEEAQGSVEAVLLNILARHASVLTLHVSVIEPPLRLPKLQHLVLHLAPVMKGLRKELETFFPCMSTLTSLKTLYVHSNSESAAACI